MDTKRPHQRPGRIKGTYPNTNRHRVYDDFEKGKHPSELVRKYRGLKKQTLIQYYENWKKIKKEGSVQGLMEVISKSLHRKAGKKKEPVLKEKVPDPEIKKEVHEENQKTEEKPQSEDFTPSTRKIFHDPFK